MAQSDLPPNPKLSQMPPQPADMLSKNRWESTPYNLKKFFEANQGLWNVLGTVLVCPILSVLARRKFQSYFIYSRLDGGGRWHYFLQPVAHCKQNLSLHAWREQWLDIPNWRTLVHFSQEWNYISYEKLITLTWIDLNRNTLGSEVTNYITLKAGAMLLVLTLMFNLDQKGLVEFYAATLFFVFLFGLLIQFNSKWATKWIAKVKE